MQIPSADPTGYCRLCFTQQQLRWLLQSSDNPMVAQIQTCLGVALAPEVDFPCTVCRLCSAALETFEALRERAMLCDAALRTVRVGSSQSIDSDVVECKREIASPEPALFYPEPEVFYPGPEPVLSSSVVPGEPNGDADFTSSSNITLTDSRNTIMVGDIKVELLNVRSEGNRSTMAQAKEKPVEKPIRHRRPFECRACKQRFVMETNLQKHIRVKHSSKQDSEAMAAAVAATRLRHPQIRPGEFKPISPKDIRKQMNMYSGSPNPTHYCCNMCSAQFRQWQPFLRHRKSHGDVDGAGQAGGDLQNMESS